MSTKPKKDKKKDKKGKKDKKKDPNEMSKVNKVFCELTITALNKKLARLRDHLTDLDDGNVKLKEELRELHYDRKDVTAFLERKLAERNTEFEELTERHTTLVKLREVENAQFLAKIKDLEDKYKAMHDQLTSEIKLITGKLNSLDEFRLERDALFAHFEDADDELRQTIAEAKANAIEMEKRAIVENNMVKKEVEIKLLQVSEDLTRSNEIRHAGYTRRLIRENIALQKEIDLMVTSQLKMQQDFNEYVFRNKEIVQNYTALEDTNKDLMQKEQLQISIIEQLTIQLEKLKTNYIEILKYRGAYMRLVSADDCQRFNYETISRKMRQMAQRNEILKFEQNQMRVQNESDKAVIANLREVICKLKHCIEVVIGTRKESSISDSSYFIDEGEEEALDDNYRDLLQRVNRQNLLSELLVILDKCIKEDSPDACSIKRSDSSLYHPGRIGFIAAARKETLSDIMYNSVLRQQNRTSDSRSMLPDHFDWNVSHMKIPEPCVVSDNDVFDIEMGTTLYVSSSREDVGGPIEEQEPLEYGDEGDDSSSSDYVKKSESSRDDIPQPVKNIENEKTTPQKVVAPTEAITDVPERVSIEEAMMEAEDIVEEVDEEDEYAAVFFY